jgi:protocatechuate 3,4-dioxygenase beta subunit
VSVTLYRPGFGPDGIAGNSDDATAVATTTTASGGAYSFTGLRPGTYQVTFGTLAGYSRTLADQGADASDSDADASTGSTATFAIAAGATNNTIDEGYYQPASIGDFVWNDANANGQQDGGETGLNGVSVTLYRPGFGPDGIAGNSDDATAVATTTTAGGGAYSFTGLRPGTYQVTFGTLAGYSRTLADQGADATDSDADASTGSTVTFAIAAGATNNTIDAGYYQPATIGDFVWNDANANGQQDGGETGLNGVSITLYRPGFGPDGIAGNSDDSTAVTTTTTAGGGAYSFTGLRPGIYQVEFGTYAGFVRTLANQGGDSSDSDADRVTGLTSTFSIAAGATNNTLDAGFYQPGTVSGHLYIDTNGDGDQDLGEPDLADVNVIVTDVNGAIQTVVSDSNGDWTATVPPGSTTADVDETDPQYPTGYTQTEGDDPTTVTAVSGSNVSAGNDGYFLPGAISGAVMADTDNNNSGDAPLSGVTLTLVDSSGNPVDGDPNTPGVQLVTTTTLPNGTYTFTNLAPGTYGVLETQPSGYRSVSDKDGGNLDEIRPIVVTAGATNNDNNFVEEQPGSISGTVWKDTDGDNDSDVAFAGVVVRLLDNSGNPVLDGFGQPVTDTTDVNGIYSFPGLDPGSYQVSQDQPSNHNSVSDTDGANNNRIGDQTPIVVSAGQNNGGNDFIEIELGVISGYVRTDDDNNGSGDTGLGGVVLNLLDGSGNPVLDGLGAPIQVSTNGSGFYQFTLVPVGTYRVSQNQPAGYASVSDVDGANNNVVGDETPIVMTPGLVVTNRDFVEVEYGAISGSVLADVDNDGDGEGPLQGVTLALLDGSGNPVDGNPSLPGVQPVTTTTNALGGYRFDDLLPGNYQVSETQPSGYGSVSDVDGGNPNLIGNITALTVNPGQEVGLRDFIEIELGTISGYVYAGTTPMGGVTLTLLDEYGNPVDGDPDTLGVQLVTTVTNGSGFYQFSGVRPGTYQVGQTQPYGYDSFGDVDGGDINIIGDVSPITLLPGQSSLNNNFVETLDTCPDDWAHWKFLHPSETPAGNPDQDAYDNFAEFAFAMPHDDGTGSQWLDHTAWIIRPSTIAPGTLEGVFIRHKGAPTNVVYTLQYAANAGNPTVWQSLVITPAMISTVDNGDCTETVTIHDLETLTGLTGGKGVVRVQADLDDDGGNDEVDHTSHTEPEGWTETPLELCCRTYNNPYLRESVFTGTVSGVSGQTLTFAVSGGSADLADIIGSGTYFVEVTSGENEGHRFDIASATGNTITLASDANLNSAAAPYNTVTGAPAASLAGDTVAIRRHWSLDELFPPASFGATGSQSTADQVQIFNGGAWIIYWLYDENDSDPQTSRWVSAADAGMADQGSTVIPPGQGMFFNNRTSVTSILAYGEVRTNDFIRPLGVANNLVGGGFPVDQAFTGTGSRAMTPSTGFFGSRDFKTADTAFVWNADATIGAPGYSTYYLANGAPTFPALLRWVKVGDFNALARDAELQFLGNRATFIRSKDGNEGYTIPAPWTP